MNTALRNAHTSFFFHLALSDFPSLHAVERFDTALLAGYDARSFTLGYQIKLLLIRKLN
jgi:hypothetical protein